MGPLLLAVAAVAFDSSRPAVLSSIVHFSVGISLLTRVNMDEGRHVTKEENAKVGLAWVLQRQFAPTWVQKL